MQLQDKPLEHARTPQTFYRFNDLPIEIRHIIWHKAMPGPRIVRVTYDELKGGYCTRVWSDKETTTEGNEDFFDDTEGEEGNIVLGETFGPGVAFALRSSKNPGIFTACKESFQLATKTYSLAFGTSRAMPTIWFNFDIDTLYLDGESMESYNYEITCLADYGTDVSRVRKLAIDTTTSEWSALPFGIDYLLGCFEHVEELAIVRHAMNSKSVDKDEELIWQDDMCTDLILRIYQEGYNLESDANIDEEKQDIMDKFDRLKYGIDGINTQQLLRGRPGRKWVCAIFILKSHFL